MASTPRRAKDTSELDAAQERIDQRPLVAKAITRALSDQYATAADEVERIIEATYRVIEREGTVDPRIRDILDESGLATQAFYRHFKSKDELLLVLLDDGRRKLAQYLLHRMEKAKDPVSGVTAWIEGILAQSSNPDAASRTRPFILGLQRLSERYAEEQLASVQLLLELLQPVIIEGVEAGQFAAVDSALASRYIYDVAVTEMEDHVVRGVKPSARESSELVAFCLRGLGASI